MPKYCFLLCDPQGAPDFCLVSNVTEKGVCGSQSVAYTSNWDIFLINHKLYTHNISRKQPPQAVTYVIQMWINISIHSKSCLCLFSICESNSHSPQALLCFLWTPWGHYQTLKLLHTALGWLATVTCLSLGFWWVGSVQRVYLTICLTIRIMTVNQNSCVNWSYFPC